MKTTLSTSLRWLNLQPTHWLCGPINGAVKEAANEEADWLDQVVIVFLQCKWCTSFLVSQLLARDPLLSLYSCFSLVFIFISTCYCTFLSPSFSASNPWHGIKIFLFDFIPLSRLIIWNLYTTALFTVASGGTIVRTSYKPRQFQQFWVNICSTFKYSTESQDTTKYGTTFSQK